MKEGFLKSVLVKRVATDSFRHSTSILHLPHGHSILAVSVWCFSARLPRSSSSAQAEGNFVTAFQIIQYIHTK